MRPAAPDPWPARDQRGLEPAPASAPIQGRFTPAQIRRIALLSSKRRIALLTRARKEDLDSWYDSVAFNAMYTGAEEALKGRLIRSIHQPDELLPAAYALAREIADNTSGVSVALNRQMLWKMLGADHPMEAHRIDSKGIYTMGKSADVKEGVVAFLEKRPAKYPDKVSTDLPDIWDHWTAPTFR